MRKHEFVSSGSHRVQSPLVIKLKRTHLFHTPCRVLEPHDLRESSNFLPNGDQLGKIMHLAPEDVFVVLEHLMEDKVNYG